MWQLNGGRRQENCAKPIKRNCHRYVPVCGGLKHLNYISTKSVNEADSRIVTMQGHWGDLYNNVSDTEGGMSVQNVRLTAHKQICPSRCLCPATEFKQMFWITDTFLVKSDNRQKLLTVHKNWNKHFGNILILKKRMSEVWHFHETEASWSQPLLYSNYAVKVKFFPIFNRDKPDHDWNFLN